MSEPFHDDESERFVARYIERAPLFLEKISIQDYIVTYTTKEGTIHEFDALEFLAPFSCQVPAAYESLTRYFGCYSCKRRGEQAKLSPPPAEEQESDYRQEFRKSSWAACIKRVYEIDPVECPKCNSQMRIIALIQDAHSIKDIMNAQGIPDFQAPPPIPKFIDAHEAIDKLYPFTTCLSQRLTTSKRRFFGDDTEAVYMDGYFLLLSSHHSSLFEPLIPFTPIQLYAS